MRYPLLRDLAAEGVPVAVTCRVLEFSKEGYFKWLARPCSQRDFNNAYLTNAAVDVNHDDPAFGYRFIADELERLGHRASENRVWRLCSEQRLWSAHSKKRGLHRRPGPPVHDDLVERDFTADAPNELWLTDITEHRTPWIPAVVATPREGGCDAGSEIHQEAEGSLLRLDRSGRHREGGGDGCRRLSPDA